MARVLKFRREKMMKIQNQSSGYLTEAKSEQGKRWSSYITCLGIQKKLSEAETIRRKESSEEEWETSLAFKSCTNFEDAFYYEKLSFTVCMIGQNASIAYLSLIKKNKPVSKRGVGNNFLMHNL
jgi:hypothetical protein